MLLSMLGLIFVGFPISFTLIFIALGFGSIGLGVDLTFNLMYLQTWGFMKDDILPAVPLFIFMGFMTERAGLMSRLFETLRHLLGGLRGSLYLAVLVTSTVFAMATGIVGASVAVMGIMAGPIMVKAGYDAPLSSGAIAAGGTLGILIPPSVMLIVMGPTIGVPVNQLYAACFGPGFMLAGMYIVYCLVRSFFNPKVGPAVPQEERVHGVGFLVREVVVGAVPLVLLIGATLGSILLGLATSTEAAGFGAFGAFVLAIAYRKLSFESLKSSAIATVATSSMVLFLAVASSVFGAIFTKLGASGLIAEYVGAMPLPDMGKLLVIMVLIFLLGWPFEWPAIVLVFLPIFLPIVESMQLGLEKRELLLWFGALAAVNMQTAYLSPPVAMSAYYLKNVMPKWSLSTIYRGMGQFMIIQVIGLVLLVFFPQIALWLPRNM